MNTFLNVHAGPKRTSSTWLQNAMCKFLPSDNLDKTAFEGNSHQLALAISLNSNNPSDSIFTEAQRLSSTTLESANNEIQRLAYLLSKNESIFLSSELFAEIDVAAIEEAFKPAESVCKRVFFVYRDTNSLLKSLFANDVIAGYRGTIADFIEDVSAERIHYYDLYPSIRGWKLKGWKVDVLIFDKNKIIELTAKFIGSLRQEVIDANEIHNILKGTEKATINASVKPEILLRISQVLNALNEHPADLRVFLSSQKYINKILLPFFRDSPYDVEHFDAEKNKDWFSFVEKVDKKRRLIFDFDL